MRVVVTFQVSRDQQKILEEVLSNVAELVYLQRLPKETWHEAFLKAKVVISAYPDREVEDLNLLKGIELMQIVWAGVDHVPFHLLPKGLKVASNSGAYAEPMAEHVVGMVLALAKRLLPNHLKLAHGIYDRHTLNKEIRGKNLGIVGFGGIGKAVARAFRCFDMKVLAINRSGETDEEVEFIGTLEDLPNVLKESDVLVLSLPLTKRTRNLITRRELRMMKQDAILINVARAHIVNQKDLYEHLRENPQFQAGFDVWWREPFSGGEFSLDYPFFELENFLGSPHNSNIVSGMFLKALRKAAENVRYFLQTGQAKNLVSPNEYEHLQTF
ncbi:MAG: hydroxyacid dehydrogenase [Thermotogae bacterium]|nr:hydroxyacid dehydrogenase [Thermotogota bacterium]